MPTPKKSKAARERRIRGRIEMSKLSKRSVLRASLGFVAASALARPYIANAAAKTASVWWAQGFIPEEDASFKNMIAAYEKASGNTIDYNIVPFAPLNAKVISALTSGDVPDLISVDGSDRRIVPQNAWVDKLVDMSDVVDTQKSHYHPTALLASRYYNNVQKKRSVYLAPYKMSDAPKTWDAYWDFFKPMQQKLRDQGMRGRYALGMQPTTTGPNDGNYLFHGFMIAYGG